MNVHEEDNNNAQKERAIDKITKFVLLNYFKILLSYKKKRKKKAK